jgi:hypothetical protein
MNNNNIYNTNNFVGTIHQDYFKSASNALASNIYTTSNTLEQHLSTTSNILENHSSNFTLIKSNEITTYFKQMINPQIDNNINTTYVCNSNIGGEIRFWTASAQYFPPQIPTDNLPFRTKIGVDGKLYCYYTYNSLISATLTTSWIDVGDTLGGIFANNVNVGITIGGIQAEILAVQNKEENDILAVYNAMIALNQGEIPYDYEELISYRENVQSGLNQNDVNGTVNSAYTNITDLINTRNSSYITSAGNNISLIISRNPTTSFFLGIGGVAFGLAYGVAQMISFNGYLNSLMSGITRNSNLTSNQKKAEINYIQDTFISSNYTKILSNTYQIGIIQGFINSNITTTQTIPNISTNAITYNGVEISNGFLKKNDGGTIYKSIAISASTAGIPATGYFGNSTGERYILQPSTTTTDYPCSLGIDLSSKSLWFSASSNYKYNWYIGGSNLLSLNSNNLNFPNGNINASNVQISGTDIKAYTQNTIIYNSPNVCKKFGFQATCSTSIIMPDALTYYKYDIDLRNYTQTKTVANPNTPYRIFTIKIFLASAYFEYFSGVPNVLSYEIYMSNESQAGGGGGYAGINICALGSPQNYNLNSILPNVLSLLRTGDFNYLSVICRSSGALFNVIIEDLIY